MSMIHTQVFSWIYGTYERSFTKAGGFFERLRQGIECGKAFPFDCPHETYFLSNESTSECVVAIIVQRGTPGDDSVATTGRLIDWCQSCGAGFWDDKTVLELDLPGLVREYGFTVEKGYTDKDLQVVQSRSRQKEQNDRERRGGFFSLFLEENKLISALRRRMRGRE